MKFKDKEGWDKVIDPGIPVPGRTAQRLPVYFGIQFCNDPNWKQDETSKASDIIRSNVCVYGDLGVLATRNIQIGDERQFSRF